MAPQLFVSYAYDDAGRVKAFTTPAGETHLFREHHDNGRIRQLEKRLPTGETIIWEFDRFGRRVSMRDTTGTTRYRYDGLGRLTELERPDYPPVSFTYDLLHRPRSIRASEQISLEYAYDFRGRLSRISTPAGPVEYRYETGQQLVIRTLPSGVWTRLAAGRDGRLESITHAGADGRVLARFAYRYHADDAIAQVTEWTPHGERTIDYGYDAVRRLVRVSNSVTGVTEYAYDAAGNRRIDAVRGRPAAGGIHDRAERFVAAAAATEKYDALGNLSMCAGPSGIREYVHDAESRIRGVRAAGRLVDYAYDGDGCLVRRTTEDIDFRFVPDPHSDLWQPIVAIDEHGDLTLYLWEQGVLLARLGTNRTEFYLHDHPGSTRCTIDGEMNVRYARFDPFGMPEDAPAVDELTPGFAGLLFDPAAGIYLTRHRAYDPEQGRFLEPDPSWCAPVPFPKDHSLYSYCGNDPVNLIDRTGAAPEVPSWVPHYPSRPAAGASPADIQQYYSDRAAYHAWSASQMPNTFLKAIEQGHSSMAAVRSGFYHAPQEFQDRLHSLQMNALQARAEGNEVAMHFWAAADAFLYATGTFTFGGALSGFQRWADPTLTTAQQAWGAVTGSSFVWWPIVAGIVIKKMVHPLQAQAQQWVDKGTNLLNDLGGDYVGSLDARLHFALGEYMIQEGNWMLRELQPLPMLIKNLPLISGGLNDIANSLADLSVWHMGQAASMPQAAPLSPLAPSTVGGVSMEGAARALDGLGMLRGVAVDPDNGRLVLLAEENGVVGLPDLRLDDIVTVFRSVYDRGEAPFVSIDPDPADPHGPTLLVRHGEGTRGTYVGWVMFEADRVMKAYSLGCDNVNGKAIAPPVEGYAGLLDIENGEPIPDETWERFWIVPGRLQHRVAGDGTLALVDVSPRIMTQRMTLRAGKLEPAENDTPSFQASVFASWMTEHYDEVATTEHAPPPAETGIAGLVPFFSELKRVALLTAIAERLRDQGVPMPQWMRDYPVEGCDLTATTPAIRVQRTGTETRQVRRWFRARSETVQYTRHLYGGVNLGTDERNVRVAENDPAADAIAAELRDALRQAGDEPVLPLLFQENGGMRGVALAGSDTRALGGFTLREADLVVAARPAAAARHLSPGCNHRQ